VKSVSGVPQNERWFFGAVLIFILLSIGPGIQLASVPEFIGYFPVLFLQEQLGWVASMVLCYIACYKLKCTQTVDYEEEILSMEKRLHDAEIAAQAKGE
jgi:hypothetical protein